MIGLIKDISRWLILFANNTGYWGFFIVMIIESTSLPVMLPAEVVLVSAGYLVAIGKLNFYIILLVCSTGATIGALINYYLSFFFGRKLIEKYGKYILINQKRFAKFELVFNSRAGLLTFFGRFMPLIKHIVSIPPGLSKMNIFKFIFFTFSGSFFFNLIMLILGFEIGEKIESKSIKTYIEIGSAFFIITIVGLYYLYNYLANKIIEKEVK